MKKVQTNAMLVAALLTAGFGLPGFLMAGEAAAVKFEARVFTNAANPTEVLPYLVARPSGGGTSQKHPLLVFLHGAGERGNDNQKQLGWCRTWVEQAVKQYDAVVVVPQCPQNARWVEVDWALPAHDMPKEMSVPLRQLFALLPSIEKECGVDPARRYIAGMSMGGYGSWDALCRRPDYFAAAVPICGGADEKQAERIARIPVWVFHGDRDNVVPVIRARNMVAALKKAGGNPKYSECAGVDHFSWKSAFAEPNLLKWLFEQKRAQAGSKYVK